MAALLLASVAGAGESTRDAIREAACRWISIYETGDVERLLELYDPEARVMLHEQSELAGLQAIEEFFSSHAESESDTRFLLLIDDIAVHGDVAHLVSRYWLERSEPEGNAYRDSGRSLLLYRRRQEDGAWLIYLDIDQSTPDAAWGTRPMSGVDSCGQPAALARDD